MSGNKAVLDSNAIINASKGIIDAEKMLGVRGGYFAPIITFIEVRDMKFGSILFLAIIVFASAIAYGQDKIIVLVRHAEKVDASADPELSAEGKERAQRLIKKAGKYRPKEIYSTDFKRTRDTVAPLAAKRKVQIQTYDARKPQDLVDKIMHGKHKRVLVSGHSNTIPALANLLGTKELFKNLDDSEYGAIWVIRIKKGKIQKIEILNY
ncbi:MAG: SixA phosphatase family protein [Pyrinomonadaceae bacterium]